MSKSHDNSIIPHKNRVLSVDENTKALFHYDLTTNDVLNGISPVNAHKGLIMNNERYVADVSHYEIEEELSIAAWVKISSISDDRGIIVKGSDSPAYYLTISSGNKVSAYWYGKSPAGYHDSNSTLSTGVWTHIAVSWSKTHLRIYINGSLDREISCSGIGRKANEIEVGRHPNRRQFSGEIKDLSIWSIEKDDANLDAHRKGIVSTKGLIGLWRMTDVEDGVIYDSSDTQSDLFLSSGAFSEQNDGNAEGLQKDAGRFGSAITAESSTVNIMKGINGRPERINTNGTTPPTAELVTMETPFGNEVWKITIPKNNDTGYSGCRATTQSIVLQYDARNYAAFTYISGDIDDVHVYPTGSRGLPSLSHTPERDIEKWQCRTNNNLSSSVGGSGSTYMTYYARTSKDKEQVFYIAATQMEDAPATGSYTNDRRDIHILEYSMTDIGIDPLGDWTIAGWFKRYPDADGWGALFGMGNYYTIEESEFQVWSNHSDVFKTYSHQNRSGRSKSIFTPSENELSEWFYTAVTHRRSTGTYNIYVWTKDRYIKDSWTIAHSHPIPDKLYVGGNGGVRPFNGLIDEVRIDNVVRSEAELMAWRYSESPFMPRGIYRKEE